MQTARRELRALAIAAATEIGRDRMLRVGRGRGQRADTLEAIDDIAERLAAPGLAALDAIERGQG
jgi:hypothetical protein